MGLPSGCRAPAKPVTFSIPSGARRAGGTYPEKTQKAEVLRLRPSAFARCGLLHGRGHDALRAGGFAAAFDAGEAFFGLHDLELDAAVLLPRGGRAVRI